ncbi:MAG: hypothetical protein KAS48_09410 [Gammaproteobacteria bacterium]|nr:hypothetical protein [Gammaproteobacteria bacterium]MCK5091254.1 hypothetical protein [Gammaproteobacteria bacterium]
MIFTISARGKDPGMPVLVFLGSNYGYIPIINIDSIFGFVERSKLYGGRPFLNPELTDNDVTDMYNVGIGLRIPFTNHYVEREEYEENIYLLEKYHRDGNAVIATNDDLARWIREDFPLYRIEASVIKNLNTHGKIDRALELYDTVVIPMKLNQDLEFLKKIKEKDRITLFANAGCALTCPSKICYSSISKMNKYEGAEFQCSQSLKAREMLGMIDFDLEQLEDIGFHRFKLLRARPGNVTGF